MVLAAGFSRRFGRDKRLYCANGEQPLLQLTVEQVVAAQLPCQVCIREDDVDVARLLQSLPVTIIRCARAHQGMGATLATAVAAVSSWDACLVALGDMPWVRPDTYQALAAAVRRDTIVQPVFADKPGNPVAFGQDFFPALCALDAERGGRDILQRHSQALRRIKLDDPGIHRDLDQSDQIPQ